MKKRIILLTIILGAISISASAQSNVPQFPPSGDNSRSQTEENNTSSQQPRKKRIIVPSIRIAFGVMDVVCTETGRCLENDFRRSDTQTTNETSSQQPLNLRSRTNQNQGTTQNFVRRLIVRRP